MARRRGKAYMAWVRSHRSTNKRRRRRARRNPWPSAGMTASPNPRRKRRYYRRAKAAVVRYKARRRASRQGRSVNILGINLPPLETVLYTGVGVVGTPIVEGFAGRFLPLEITGSLVGKYALRIGSLLGLTWLANTLLGANEAKAVAAGGGAYVLTSAIREFAPGIVPGLSGMGAYTQMGAYANMRGRFAGLPGQATGTFGAPGGSFSTGRFDRFSR